MNHSYSLFLAYAFALTWPSAAGTSDFGTKCLTFKPHVCAPEADLQVLEYVPAGTNMTFAGNAASCNRASQGVAADLCRVALSVPTSDRSAITMEVWLPGDWSGRFLATGNGGVDGCIRYEDLAYGAQHGFATVGANNGHNGTTLVTALNNEDVVVDYAHRSLHTAVGIAKTVIDAFYDKPPDKSYFLGCSLGGRQGIDSADKYPTDFDGIVAGAPAVDFNNLYSWRASFFPLTGSNTSEEFIQSSWWKTWIHEEVLRQCDDIDGAEDGIIEDPLRCHFNPETLLCSTSRPTDCLTDSQVDIVRQVYSPYTYPNGSLIFPAMQPGGEIATADGLLSGSPFAYSAEWFKYVIYSNSSWDPTTYTTNDAEVAEVKNPADIRTWPSDLAPFRQRGSKVLMFHGLQDNQITSFNSPRFYERLRGSNGFGYEKMDEWLRFFRISGMNHCNSGPGGWVLGQGGNAAAGIGYKPESNVLAALIEWVEGGVAPTTILGTKFVNDTVFLGVQLQRRHCKWPATNVFTGGDVSSPESWKCVAP